ncbi:TonB-dependent receptor plug domain-containing protein [Carboxylicivirga marina]|uniref:TonB-dependent receptor plug domain-containing protein n=1 Tax=Carboxylicivirga marina TaxID=2800988 RepID=UPI002599CF9C|nr:TonB-dependent receptor [uncultured Carboxylicivirga sp.]
MRYRLLILLLVLAWPVLADDEVRDSVKVQEVEITASRLSHFASTEREDRLDTLTLQKYANQDLGTLLQKSLLVNIQSNGGLGGLTTASIRGASSNQTLVTWNGLPVNSLTTGSADLSLIHAGSFNDISITYGAAGSLYGSGTMGGTIELTNEPSWNNGLSANVRAEIGSFSNYKGNMSFAASSSVLSYQAQLQYQDSKNNFAYTDEFDHGHPTEKLTHNENALIGTIHNLYWKAGKNLFDFGAWYQVKEKNIPGLMGVGEPVSHQTQKDSTLKIYVGWRRLIGNCRLDAKTAYSYDFLRYTDKETADSESYKIFSEIAAKRWLSDLSSRWYLIQNLSIDLNGRYSRLEGITSNYAENIIEHEWRFNTAIKYTNDIGVFIGTIGKDWNTTEANQLTAIGEGVDSDGSILNANELPNPPLMFSLSSKVIIRPTWLALRGRVSTHFRRPTFNDRYWVPGGNLNLKAEEGFNFELGAEIFEQQTKVGFFSGDVAYYRSDNNESIAWKPAGSIWQPINTGAVISHGFDIDVNHQLSFNKFQLINKLLYGYNDTYDNSEESASYKEALGYRPKHIFKANCDIVGEKWNAGINFYSRSKCFTWEGRQVDAYALFDISAGYHMVISKVDVDLLGRVENVLNTSYQLVRAYPMPGRAYYLTVNINF